MNRTSVQVQARQTIWRSVVPPDIPHPSKTRALQIYKKAGRAIATSHLDFGTPDGRTEPPGRARGLVCLPPAVEMSSGPGGPLAARPMVEAKGRRSDPCVVSS